MVVSSTPSLTPTIGVCFGSFVAASALRRLWSIHLEMEDPTN